jgi:acyl-CoA thioester hydrolase
MTVAQYKVRSHQGVWTVPEGGEWDLILDRPRPFAIVLSVEPDEIDAFGHANNTAYQRWTEACAWEHSAAVGLSPERCLSLQRGMALRHLEIDFSRASFLGQSIVVANWITEVGRLRAERRFQVMDATDGSTLARAHGKYVCIDTTTGAPVRMPKEFVDRYTIT